MICSFRDAVARLAAYRRQQRLPHLDFVVAGMPRSGTRFAAHLFTDLGRTCGHEWIFDVPQPTLKTALGSLFNLRLRNADADASWLAAPLLWQLNPRAAVLHQVRNPVLVIRSLMGIGFFQRGPRHRLRGYTQFAARYLPPLPPDPLRSCMLFWMHWNRLIPEQCGDRDYLRYRLEDLTRRQPQTLESLAQRVTGGDAERLAAAIAHLPTDVNRRQRDHSICWKTMPEGELKDELRQQALDYGYCLKELEQG